MLATLPKEAVFYGADRSYWSHNPNRQRQWAAGDFPQATLFMRM